MSKTCTTCNRRLTFWENLFSSKPPFCKDCGRIHKAKVKEYITKLKTFGADSYLTQEEENELVQLQKKLGLGNDDLRKAQPLLTKYRQLTKHADIAKYEAKLAEVGSDKYLTSEEEKELNLLRGQLNLTDEDIHPTVGTLVRLKRLTAIQDGNLPIFVVNLNLKKGEICHFAIPCNLVEERTRSQYVGGSRGVSVRVMKGVTYRVGSFKGHTVSTIYKTITDSGMFYITNRRILFVGHRKNITYSLDKVVDYIPYRDGIQFSKENEASLKIFTFSIPEAMDEIGMIISKVLSQ